MWIEGAPLKSSPLLSPSCATPLPPSLSLSCGSPKGYVGARATPSLHDEVLREFWIGSKPIYFLCCALELLRLGFWCVMLNTVVSF
jgi:hypothetical protein